MKHWYRVLLKCAAHGNDLSHHLMVEAAGYTEARSIAESILDLKVVTTAEVTFEIEGK